MGVDDLILALPTLVYIHEDRHRIGCEKLTEHINFNKFPRAKSATL